MTTDELDILKRIGSPGWDNFGNFVLPEIKPENHNAAIAGYSCLSLMLAKQVEERDRKLAEAATALEAKDRRIAELEAALAPFAKAGQLFGPLPIEGYEEGIYSPAAGPEYSFGGNALRAARAALEPSDKGVGN